MVVSREVLTVLVFLAVCLLTVGVAGLLPYLLSRDRRRSVARLRELGGLTPDQPATNPGLLSALPMVGTLLLPRRNEARARLQGRLVIAGIYRAEAVSTFQGARLILALALPLPAGLLPWLGGVLSAHTATWAAIAALGVGMLVPGLWLDARIRHRQTLLRRGLPDALDMIVLCLEGGVSLVAALQRVTAELQTAHPLLAAEMNIVQREIQMGMSAGESIKKFGERCGLPEVRDLASVLLQSERFGAGVVKALRIHADTARVDRQQRAEEMAQKASVKILFPTLLCIFPAIFIVILGPAAYQIAGLFSPPK